MSKYGVFSGSYFPAFGLNTERYEPEKTPYLDAFHAVSQSDSDDDFKKDSLSGRAARRTYLKTYNQIDKSKFPTRERFANAIVNPFNEAQGKLYLKIGLAVLNPTRKGVNIFTYV